LNAFIQGKLIDQQEHLADFLKQCRSEAGVLSFQCTSEKGRVSESSKECDFFLKFLRDGIDAIEAILVTCCLKHSCEFNVDAIQKGRKRNPKLSIMKKTDIKTLNTMAIVVGSKGTNGNLVKTIIESAGKEELLILN
jgi:hypothetical protein